MMDYYAKSMKTNRKSSIQLDKMDTEVIAVFGNGFNFLSLMIKYASSHGSDDLYYWSRLNGTIANELGLKKGAVEKYLRTFVDFGIITRVHTGLYSFNKKYIKL